MNANQWQDYLERKRLYPDSMLGFRHKLSKQDAMLHFREAILDKGYMQDNRVILGLDLQSAFDKVKHSPILAQVS